MIDYQDVFKEGIELINLTPHKIIVLDTDFIAMPVSGDKLIRVKKTSMLQGKIMNCEVFSIQEEIYGSLPKYNPKKMYIVSQRVAEAMAVDADYKERVDFIYPAHIEHEHIRKPLIDKYGKEVKDSKGDVVTTKMQIIKGCRGFEFARRCNIL